MASSNVKRLQIEDHPLVSFLPLDLTSTESLETVVSHVDYVMQYGEDEEPKEVSQHIGIRGTLNRALIMSYARCSLMTWMRATLLRWNDRVRFRSHCELDPIVRAYGM